MGVWNRLSLAVKLLLPICLSLIIGLTVLALIVRHKAAQETHDISFDLGHSVADAAATDAQLRFNTGFEVARVIAETAISAKKNNMPREQLIEAAANATRANPDVIGSWVEIPDGLYDDPAKNADYVGKPGMTKAGRISIYVTHKDADVNIETPAEGDKEAILQEYFKGAFESGKEYC